MSLSSPFALGNSVGNSSTDAMNQLIENFVSIFKNPNDKFQRGVARSKQRLEVSPPQLPNQYPITTQNAATVCIFRLKLIKLVSINITFFPDEVSAKYRGRGAVVPRNNVLHPRGLLNTYKMFTERAES